MAARWKGKSASANEPDKGCDHYLSGFNFINVLPAAFTHVDPKSAKKLLDLTVFFALLGSLCVKAACRTLMKLTPGESVRERDRERRGERERVSERELE